MIVNKSTNTTKLDTEYIRNEIEVLELTLAEYFRNGIKSVAGVKLVYDMLIKYKKLTGKPYNEIKENTIV